MATNANEASAIANAAPSNEPAWHASLPQPVSRPKNITAEELKALITKEGAVSGRDYIVVDVRRTDFEVRCSLYPLNGPNLWKIECLYQRSFELASSIILSNLAYYCPSVG
jgi:hypothetical protein